MIGDPAGVKDAKNLSQEIKDSLVRILDAADVLVSDIIDIIGGDDTAKAASFVYALKQIGDDGVAREIGRAHV